MPKNPIKHLEGIYLDNFEMQVGTIGEYAFTLTISKRKDNKLIKVKFVRHEKTSIYYAISDYNSKEFKDIFLTSMTKCFPDISKMFLTNGEIKQILEKIEIMRYRVMVEFGVAKKRLHEGKKESVITYTDTSYKEIWDKISKDDQWIQSIRYRAEKNMKDKATYASFFKGTITRDCHFIIWGEFKILTDVIIPHALELISKRNDCILTTSKSAPNLEPKPIMIKFGNPLFSNIEKNKSYLKSIAEMPSYSVSAYHNNPYIHASLVDYEDGSSYDLWVLSKNNLIIIPRFEASIASLSRLVNHVFERIGEGRVENFEESESLIN